MSTNVVSMTKVVRSWHLVDAKDKTLGRMAGEIARNLMGKYKTNYVPYLDMGDFVIVTNAGGVKLTGKKAEQKTYTYHSGYPGGLRQENFASMIERHPEEVVRKAVWGMIPKTKQGKQMIKRLKIYTDSEHPFKAQIKETKNA